MNKDRNAPRKAERPLWSAGNLSVLGCALAVVTLACSSIEQPTSPTLPSPTPANGGQITISPSGDQITISPTTGGQITIPIAIPRFALSLVPSPAPIASATPGPGASTPPTVSPTPVPATPAPSASTAPAAPPPTIPPAPDSDPAGACPTPDIIRIKVHVPSGANGWVIDSVALTCDQSACASFTVPGGTPRECCPLGAEGSSRRVQCENEMVPDGPTWQIRKGSHRQHPTNPWLHFVSPPGSVRACLPQGNCSDWLSVGGG